MRRAGLALLVVVLAAAAAGPAAAAGRPTVSDLEAEIVCPVCETTLDQSNAPIAQRMKQLIRQHIAAGWTEERIKAGLVDQFGPGVLAEPPKSGFDLLAWLLPLAGLLSAAAIVGYATWRWSRRPAAEEPLDPEDERRLDDALARFEG